MKIIVSASRLRTVGQLAMRGVVAICLLVAMQTRADYTVYPIPQQMTMGEGRLFFTQKVNAVLDQGVDMYTKGRLLSIMMDKGITLTIGNKPQRGCTNIYLGINGRRGKAGSMAKKRNLPTDVFGVKGKYDRHVVSLCSSGKGDIADIIILGEHTNAVFYGLATLEQILEQGETVSGGLSLRPVTVCDYADMQYRGIVEGYYGYPYSFDVKKDLMRFFMRYKMNTYLYGAKSDPYHSGYWRDAYPEIITETQEKNGWLSQKMIKDLSELSLETKVNFIWAIHPNSGKAVDFHSAESTSQAVDDVMAKFVKMHSLGVRQFAVFLDDAGWDMDDVGNYRDFLTKLQTTLEHKYNKDYENPSDTVKPIHYVPHIYAINFASEQHLKAYFDAISQTPPGIVVYTTGSGVWSSLRNDDFLTMQQLMNRPVALWWNYPCNDNKDGRIYTADMVTTLHEMGLPTPDDQMPQCLGIVSNPMQQGSVAKICLFGVADYAWNNCAFNSRQNWEASFPRIVGQANAPLYKYLSQYLRHDDPEALGAMIDKYKTDFAAGYRDSRALCDTLEAIRLAANEMLQQSPQTISNVLLMQELRPWLMKLSRMAELGLDLLQLPHMRDAIEKNNVKHKIAQAFADFRDSREYKVEALEGMGENPPSELHSVEPSHKYLMPFLLWLAEQQ